MARETPAPTRREPNVQNRRETETRRQTSSVSLGDILVGILGQIFSGSVRNGGFVVNDQATVMQRVNNNWYQVGKLSRSNNARYPYVITGNRNGQMYVDQRGNIINRAGQVLGLLQAVRG